MLSVQWSNRPAVYGANGGVYVLWRRNTGSCVYVGHADNIADRLRLHLTSWSIGFAPPAFAWAEVEADQRAGVQRYLVQLYNPLQGAAWPTAEALAVNLPIPGPRTPVTRAREGRSALARSQPEPERFADAVAKRLDVGWSRAEVETWLLTEEHVHPGVAALVVDQIDETR